MGVEFTFLVIPAPGVAARPRRPVEAIAVPFGELVAGEGGPVPPVRPPQDARKRREKGPEDGPEPDFREKTRTPSAREDMEGEDERQEGSTEDEN